MDGWMGIYVCKYVCMYVRMYACMYVCVYACTYVCMSVRTCAHIHVQGAVRLYVEGCCWGWVIDSTGRSDYMLYCPHSVTVQFYW